MHKKIIFRLAFLLSMGLTSSKLHAADLADPAIFSPSDQAENSANALPIIDLKESIDISDPDAISKSMQEAIDQPTMPPESNSINLPLLSIDEPESTEIIHSTMNNIKEIPEHAIPILSTEDEIISSDNTEKVNEDDDINTEDAAEVGGAIAGTSALGLVAKKLLIDHAPAIKKIAIEKGKELATQTVPEQIKKKILTQKLNPEEQKNLKADIKVQKPLINNRLEQAERKLTYYSKTTDPNKKLKWQTKLTNAKKLQANFDRQKELLKQNKNKELSQKNRELNAIEIKNLSKQNLTAEQQRLNARLHKYNEQPAPLSQKQLIKKEQATDDLKIINKRMPQLTDEIKENEKKKAMHTENIASKNKFTKTFLRSK